MLALSAHQPFAELISLGIKTAELRAKPTLREGLDAAETASRLGYVGHSGTHSSEWH